MRLEKDAANPPVLDEESPGTPQPAATEEVIAETTPLQWGANCLLNDYVLRTGRFPTHGSGEISRSNAVLRVQAAASVMATDQSLSLEKTVHLVEKLVRVRHLRAIAFLEHVLYDETQLRVRMEFNEEPEKQTGRIFVVESRWSMLLQTLPLDSEVPQQAQQSSDMLVLQGSFSPKVRGAANATGDTIHDVLQTTTHMPSQLPDVFEQLFRLVEVDQCGANLRAEALVMATRKNESTQQAAWRHLASICLCDKIHAGAQKAWALHADVVSGLVHACKVLGASGQLRKLKDALTTLVEQRFVVLTDEAIDPATETFKHNMHVAFLPSERHSRRRATARAACAFFNGSWTKRNTLQHICAGVACCKTPGESRCKASILLRKLAGSLHPTMFNRANWLRQVLTQKGCKVGSSLLCQNWNQHCKNQLQ